MGNNDFSIEEKFAMLKQCLITGENPKLFEFYPVEFVEWLNNYYYDKEAKCE